MSADVNPETKAWQDLRPSRGSSQFSWWKYAASAIGTLAMLAGVGMWIVGANSTGEFGAMLTQEITRGELLVTVTEQGMLESSDNTEIICKVRGNNTVNWVIENGTVVRAGDDLIKLDTLYIEEQINERSKYAHWSRAGAESWKAQMARRTLAIPEYLEGRYVAELMTLEKDLAIAESRLRTAQNMLAHATMMAERGYVSELEIEQREFRVIQSRLTVEVKLTDIDVLKRFTKEEELERLKGELNVAKAQFGANDERAFADASRRDRALDELQYCIVKAEKDGLVIHPSAARWKNAPEITEGATVHKNQVLLLMPDMTKMQVRVGIHESIIERVKAGLPVRVSLPSRVLDGVVHDVATIAQPAGWWTGNAVKYDTIIMLPSMEELLLEEIQRRGEKIPVAERTALQQTLETDQQERTEVQKKLVDDAQVEFLPDYKALKPGMSAEVEVILARHLDVLKIPVAAVVETTRGFFCWVWTTTGVERRVLNLGDSNDVFVVVREKRLESAELVALGLDPSAALVQGLKEGEQVVLNPLAFIREAQDEAIQVPDDTEQSKLDSPGSTRTREEYEDGSDKQADDKKQAQPTKPKAAKPQAQPKPE